MENFIVSARKYRPATFQSVVGQTHITSTLKNAIARGQLAHAYLFCGPRGVGKTTCARIFAKAINCLNPQNLEACGECESCRAFNEGRSMNIHELDAASNNSVNDIRNLTDQVRVPPQIGKYSVYIIDEVHMLSQQAFNAFLKTLEEPPSYAIFILATTEKYKILPTILSRCQIFDFNRIRVEDSVGYLKYIASQEGVSYDDESLHLISQKADGGMRDALSMFDKAVSFCGNNLNFRDVAATLNVLDYDTYFNMTELIARGDYKQCLTGFDAILKKGFSGQTFIAGLNNHFRDLLMCKDPQTIPLLEITGSLLERYKSQSTLLDVSFLFGAISLLSTTDASLKTATNQRLHVELALMKLCGMGQKKNDFEGDPIELPELHKEPDSQTVVTATPVAPAAKTVVPPVVEQKTVEQPVAESKMSAQPAPAPKPQNVSASPAVSPHVENTPKESKKSGGSIFGVSLKEIKNITAHPVVAETQSGEHEQPTEIDPDTERKISEVKDQFLENLHAVRPRIANALQNMSVNGNKICATVCSSLIYEDIMLNRLEILNVLFKSVKINGAVEFDIKVEEIDTRVNPITLEDKYAYLMKKNPALGELQKRLNLELE